MAYLTYAQYKAINPTSSLADDSEFTFLAERASDIVNDLAKNRINFFGFDNFSTGTQTAIQKAAAAQIDLLDAEGGSDAVNGNNSAALSGVSIGRYSEQRGTGMNAKAGGTYQMVDGVPIAPMIRMYLRPTNLLYKGIGCFEIDFFNI